MSPLFEHLFGPGRDPRNVAVADDLQRRWPRGSGRTLPQLALRWATCDRRASAHRSSGCRIVAEVDDDVAALDWSLDPPTVRRSTQIFARHGVDPVPRPVDRDDEGVLTMGDELAGKVAIVTGGAGGIGRAAVERFVAEGAQVVVADVDEGTAARSSRRRSVALPRSSGSTSRNADDVQAAVDLAVEHFGGLDVMFNNAGIPQLVRAASSTTTSPTSRRSWGSTSTA